MANVDVARVSQYKSNVIHQYQQFGSKLRPHVRIETVKGKQAFFERVSGAEADELTVRHADTGLTESSHSRRMVTLRTYFWNDYIDDADRIRMLIDPTSPYAKLAGGALGRKTDDRVYITSRGNAFSDETGSTTVALPAAQKIAHGGTGLTLVKIVESSKILSNGFVPMEDRVMIANPTGLEDILNDSTITSADFNSVRLLMSGSIDSFMGYKWVIYNFAIESAVYYAVAYHKDSLGLALGKDMIVKIDVRPDKHYSTQVYASLTIGATRVQDEGVVEVAFQ